MAEYPIITFEDGVYTLADGTQHRPEGPIRYRSYVWKVPVTLTTDGGEKSIVSTLTLLKGGNYALETRLIAGAYFGEIHLVPIEEE